MKYAVDDDVKALAEAFGRDQKRAESAATAAARFSPPTAAPGVFRPTVQRFRDSVSALDMMSAGGLDEAVRNREATGTDATEITARLQEALSACAQKRWRLDVPQGSFWLNARLHAEKPVTIQGAGMDATELYWTGASATEGLLIEAGGVVKKSSVSDLTLLTGKTALTDAITIDYSSLISGAIIMPRAEAHAHVSRVRTRGTGGYTVNGWNRALVGASLLGLWVGDCRFNGVYTGAYGSMPTSAAGIDFGGDGSPVQLFVTRTNISAVQDAVFTHDAEGIYLHNNEFVTVGRGFRCVNAVNESGLFITDNHVATVDKAFHLSRMAESNIRGNVLYQVHTASPIQYIVIETGCDDVQIEGNIFRRLGATGDFRSVVVNGGDGIVIGRNLHDIGSTNTAIEINGGRALVYDQSYEGVNSAAPITNASGSSQFQTFRGYTGDLNAINTDWRMPIQTHMLAAGVTNIPAAWAGSSAGGIVETRSFDGNTAVQAAQHPNRDNQVFRRRKSGGTWGAWE